VAEPTLARMFWERVERGGDRPAQMVKTGTAWTEVSARALGEEVREVALGLLALGRQKGDTVGLLSQTRAEWVRADFAILSAGCVTIPVYPSYPADAVAFIVKDSGAKTIFVEDATQLQKVQDAVKDMPGLESVVLIQGAAAPELAAGARKLRLLTWERLRAEGRSARKELEPVLAQRLAAGGPDDVATIVYTSGTTGQPKGVVQTHGNHLAALAAAGQVTEVRPGDVHLLFLPLAHSFARFESFIGVHQGLVTAFAESLEKLSDNLKEVRPHFICSVPRVFEKVYAKVLSGVEAGPSVKKRLFYWALGVGREVSRRQREGKPIGMALGVQHGTASKLVFSKLHAALGGRLRFCFSGGAPLAREIAEFFHSVGVLIIEGYGLTETCPILAANRLSRFKFGTVGLAFPGVELKIAEDGEILARGANIAKGYYRRPEETAEVFKPEGWFHTGDIGEIDADGFLRITDRKKDLIKTAGGSYVAPQYIENLLKGDPFVSQALVYGDRRPYPVALVTLNPEELGKFARNAGLGDKPLAELARNPAIVERVRQTVDGINEKLASYAKVKRFAVLPADFTVEGGELTPTLKVKRKVVSHNYADLIESLYQS
jgi:long-chain acyl-CoA synthetase